MPEGAEPSIVTNAWLDEHIRSKGALGKRYPQFEFIMEGDTPSCLGLANNGLESFRSPAWGGWGGPRRAERGGALVLVQVLVDGAAQLAGDRDARAVPDPGQATRQERRHHPARPARHLLSG